MTRAEKIAADLMLTAAVIKIRRDALKAAAKVMALSDVEPPPAVFIRVKRKDCKQRELLIARVAEALAEYCGEKLANKHRMMAATLLHGALVDDLR